MEFFYLLLVLFAGFALGKVFFKPSDAQPSAEQSAMTAKQQSDKALTISYVCSKAGVEYVHASNGGLALHVDADGTPITCEEAL